MIATQTIAEQLTDIYFRYENWHIFKMSYKQALDYHSQQLREGNIHVVDDNGEVLGYYEKHFVYNVCFLDNVFVKDGHRQGRVFHELCRHFFSTMPDNITHIIGEKVKLDGKVMKVKIRRSNNGKH